ncbi:MAG: DNA alkylation repair protein [Alphaproteobacteria bacterium]|nr:DNA alkylation repair protein [Alphaproteobacteria bacterium]
MLNFIEQKFAELKNPTDAVCQTAYMRYKFKFLGIKKPLIKNVMVELLKQFNPSLEEIVQLADTLYYKEYREYQYLALYLLEKSAKKLNESHLSMLEKMTLHDSWWDSVDVIASNIIGMVLFKLPPYQRKPYLDKWENSDNLWLLRTCIIFQMKYKKDIDTEYLAHICQKFKHHEDFFIRKAIGWILREYSKTDYNWVKVFVSNNPDLSNLSKKEALRLQLC